LKNVVNEDFMEYLGHASMMSSHSLWPSCWFCRMDSHSVTCHPAEVRISPLTPAEAGTRFSDPGGMQGW